MSLAKNNNKKKHDMNELIEYFQTSSILYKKEKNVFNCCKNTIFFPWTSFLFFQIIADEVF